MTEPATAQRQIKLELSSQHETLRVGQSSVFFRATVYNDSDRFASFQLRLLAAGVTTTQPKSWYRLAPSVSSKIPAGDCTHFHIEVFDLPPITDQFRGAIDLTVEVTSRELENQYDLEYLRLLVEGFQGKPPLIALSSPRQQARPGERAVIVCQVQNPTATPLNVTLGLGGLPEAWFPQGSQQQCFVDPGKVEKVAFSCELPPLHLASNLAPSNTPNTALHLASHLALSQSYPLRLEATGQFPMVTALGEFYILPAGTVSLGCDPLEASIPNLVDSDDRSEEDTARFTLQFHNQSNVNPELQIDVADLQPTRWWRFWQNAPPEDETLGPQELPTGVSLGDIPLGLPLGMSSTPLAIQRRRPWFGWTRLHAFQVTARLPDPAITLRTDQQTLQLQIFPVIPFWQQFLGLLLAMGLGALTWFFLADSRHQGAVNSVQFSGQGIEVLSGSDDQTVRHWHVIKGHLKPLGRLVTFDKAVQVLRYRPVNNDQVAIGFENGDIQIINLLTEQRSRLVADKDDRVLALAFSRDARTLYSGHGSGLVLPWDVSRLTQDIAPPPQAYDLGFAIQAMAMVMNDDRWLAIAGRYNRLELLNLQPTQNGASPTTPAEGQPFINRPPSRKVANLPPLIKLAYPAGGSTDYISSLSAAQQNPTRLAVADTQGRISLWDLQACLNNQGRCEAIDRPWLGHGGSPVRAVALSADGCFLASASDDGQVKLWALDEQGNRRTSSLEGRVLMRFPKAVNTVDIIQIHDRIWVISGGVDGQVRLESASLQGGGQGAGQGFDVCPALTGG